MRLLPVLLLLLLAGCGTPVRECLKYHNVYHGWVVYNFHGLWEYKSWDIDLVCDEWKVR